LPVIALSSTTGAQWLDPNYEFIEAVARTGYGLVDLWEASPLRLDSNQPKTDEIIDSLYFTEFLAKMNCVTVPKGETLQAAFERAKAKPPPAKILAIPNIQVRLFANLCRELQEMAGDQPFMLCQMRVAKLFGHSSHRTISNWIRALKTLGVLKPAEAAIPNVRAARYFYVE
jgi:hypothetical protein